MAVYHGDLAQDRADAVRQGRDQVRRLPALPLCAANCLAVDGDHQPLAGQPISTYEQVLRDYLGQGYPLGGFAVLGIAGRLTGLNLAWCFQPTIAVIAAALGMAIYGASATLIVRRACRPWSLLTEDTDGMRVHGSFLSCRCRVGMLALTVIT